MRSKRGVSIWLQAVFSLSICSLLLSGCTQVSRETASEVESVLPETRKDQLKFIGKQLLPPLRDKFTSWAGTERPSSSKSVVYEIDSDNKVGNLRYNLNSDDYWAIFWNQQFQTGQDFITFENSPRYGNPWCVGYTVDVIAQLSYAFYSERSKYPEWDIWPTNGLIITINNYTYQEEKDKYGNLLPDKLINQKDASFGIKMSDFNKINWESGEMAVSQLDSLKPLSIPDIAFCTKSFVMGAILS